MSEGHVKAVYDTVADDYADHSPSTEPEQQIGLAMVAPFASLLPELTGAADPLLRPGPATDLFLGGNMQRILPDRRSADATDELTR